MRIVWAVLAVAAILLAGAGAATRLTGPDSASAAGFPDPPDGSRWVGMDRVVVAVPGWWTTGETQCGAPVEDTVYFDAAAVYDCSSPVEAGAVREVSALGVLDGTCCYGEFQIRSMTEVAQVAGHEVVEARGCEDWFEGVCRRLFAVPDLGVVFAVTIAEEGDGDYVAIRDSVRVLPDGLTTVPLRVGSDFTPSRGLEPSLVGEVVATVERAGLRAEVETVRPSDGGHTGMPTDLPPGSLLEMSPSPGSVVEEGATVTISVLGGR